MCIPKICTFRLKPALCQHIVTNEICEKKFRIKVINPHTKNFINQRTIICFKMCAIDKITTFQFQTNFRRYGQKNLRTITSNNSRTTCTRLRCIIQKQNEIIQTQAEILQKMKIHRDRLLPIAEYAQNELKRFLRLVESR